MGTTCKGQAVASTAAVTALLQSRAWEASAWHRRVQAGLAKGHFSAKEAPIRCTVWISERGDNSLPGRCALRL